MPRDEEVVRRWWCIDRTDGWGHAVRTEKLTLLRSRFAFDPNVMRGLPGRLGVRDRQVDNHAIPRGADEGTAKQKVREH